MLAQHLLGGDPGLPATFTDCGSTQARARLRLDAATCSETDGGKTANDSLGQGRAGRKNYVIGEKARGKGTGDAEMGSRAGSWPTTEVMRSSKRCRPFATTPRRASSAGSLAGTLSACLPCYRPMPLMLILDMRD